MRTGRPKGIKNPERTVLCVICAKQFTTDHSQGRYCSQECRQRGHARSWNKYSQTRNRPPEVLEAYNAVNAAIKRGDLVPQPCEVCGVEPTDAHHPDYSKPLGVVWLCRSHHREIHGRNKTDG